MNQSSSSTPNLPLPDIIAGTLARIRSRVRRMILLRGIFATLAAALAALFAVMATDTLFTIFHAWQRWALSIAAYAFTAATAFAFLIRPFARTFTQAGIARMIEIRHPELQERLSSAVELLTSNDAPELRGSETLIRALSEDAARDAALVRPRQEISSRTARPHLVAGLLLTLILVTLFAIRPRQTAFLAARAAAPFLNLPNVHAAELVVFPGDVILAEKAPLQIALESRNMLIHSARLLKTLADGRTVVEELVLADSASNNVRRFTIDYPSVTEGFRYRIHAGDALTRFHNVSVVPPPVVQRLDLRIDFPEYSGRAPLLENDSSGDIHALAGARVAISAVISKPIRSARMVVARQTISVNPGVVTRDEQGRTLAAFGPVELDPGLKGQWWLACSDDAGFTNARVERAIEAERDLAPAAAIDRLDRKELNVNPDDRIPIFFSARDDLGLSALDLRLDVDGRRLPDRELKSPGILLKSGPEATGQIEIDLNDSEFRNARRVQIQARALDTLPPMFNGPQTGLSEVVTLVLNSSVPSYAQQVLTSQEKRMRQGLEKARNELLAAKAEFPTIQTAIAQPQDKSLIEAPVKRLGANLDHADGSIRDLAGDLDRSYFGDLPSALRELADSHLSSARNFSDQIRLLDSPDDRKVIADQAAGEVDQAIAGIDEMLKRLPEVTGALSRAIELDKLAARQTELVRSRLDLEQPGPANTSNATAVASNAWQQAQNQLAGDLSHTLRGDPASRERLAESDRQTAGDNSREARDLSQTQGALAKESERVSTFQQIDQSIRDLATDQGRLADEVGTMGVASDQAGLMRNTADILDRRDLDAAQPSQDNIAQNLTDAAILLDATPQPAALRAAQDAASAARESELQAADAVRKARETERQMRQQHETAVAAAQARQAANPQEAQALIARAEQMNQTLQDLSAMARKLDIDSWQAAAAASNALMAARSALLEPDAARALESARNAVAEARAAAERAQAAQATLQKTQELSAWPTPEQQILNARLDAQRSADAARALAQQAEQAAQQADQAAREAETLRQRDLLRQSIEAARAQLPALEAYAEQSTESARQSEQSAKMLKKQAERIRSEANDAQRAANATGAQPQIIDKAAAQAKQAGEAELSAARALEAARQAQQAAQAAQQNAEQVRQLAQQAEQAQNPDAAKPIMDRLAQAITNSLTSAKQMNQAIELGQQASLQTAPAQTAQLEARQTQELARQAEKSAGQTAEAARATAETARKQADRLTDKAAATQSQGNSAAAMNLDRHAERLRDAAREGERLAQLSDQAMRQAESAGERADALAQQSLPGKDPAEQIRRNAAEIQKSHNQAAGSAEQANRLDREVKALSAKVEDLVKNAEALADNPIAAPENTPLQRAERVLSANRETHSEAQRAKASAEQTAQNAKEASASATAESARQAAARARAAAETTRQAAERTAEKKARVQDAAANLTPAQQARGLAQSTADAAAGAQRLAQQAQQNAAQYQQLALPRAQALKTEASGVESNAPARASSLKHDATNIEQRIVRQNQAATNAQDAAKKAAESLAQAQTLTQQLEQETAPDKKQALLDKLDQTARAAHDSENAAQNEVSRQQALTQADRLDDIVRRQKALQERAAKLDWNRDTLLTSNRADQVRRLASEQAMLAKDGRKLSDDLEQASPKSGEWPMAVPEPMEQAARALAGGRASDAREPARQAANALQQAADKLKAAADNEWKNALGGDAQEDNRKPLPAEMERAGQLAALAGRADALADRQQQLAAALDRIDALTPVESLNLDQERLRGRIAELAESAALLSDHARDFNLPQPVQQEAARIADLSTRASQQAGQAAAQIAKLEEQIARKPDDRNALTPQAVQQAVQAAQQSQQAAAQSLEQASAALGSFEKSLMPADSKAQPMPEGAPMARAYQNARETAKHPDADSAIRSASSLGEAAERAAERARSLGAEPHPLSLQQFADSAAQPQNGEALAANPETWAQRFGTRIRDWLRLPDNLESEVLQSASDEGPEEYRQLIRIYFEEVSRRGGEE